MTDPKVSVIIPVYNTGKYLEDSVSSIQNQTFRDIEIIIINDGSTDNCAQILKKLSQNDKRIRLFAQSNQGQSVARNLGLDNACGEYIYFMDSDDILDHDAINACYEKCILQNLEMVIFDADVFYEDEKSAKSGFNYIRSGQIEDKIYDGKDLMELLLNKNIFKAVPWLFFVKRELLEKQNLRFFPGIIHEDELFTPILYLTAERIGYLPKTFFHRRIRENSTMTNSFSKKNLKGYFSVIENLEAYIKNCDYRVGKIVDYLIRNIAISIGDQAVSLTFRIRYSILIYFFRKNILKHLTLKSTILLLSPFSSAFKKKVIKPLFNSITK